MDAAVKTYWVYLLASRSGVLYVGMTNDLARRVEEHRAGVHRGFTRRYYVNRLVHAEPYANVRDALAREKQLKAWRRAKKVALVNATNPRWDDLGRLGLVAL